MFRASLILIIYLASVGLSQAQKAVVVKTDSSLVFTAPDGRRMLVSAYGSHVLRIQVVRPGSALDLRDRNETLVPQRLRGHISLRDSGKKTEGYAFYERDFSGTWMSSGIRMQVDKQTLQFNVYETNPKGMTLLGNAHVEWTENQTSLTWNGYKQMGERFLGLGHQAYGQVDSLNLVGRATRCNYGEYDQKPKLDPDGWMAQAALTVPLIISDRDYGIFLNSTFHHRFELGMMEQHNILLEGVKEGAVMDFFLIAGTPEQVLERYIALTGHPRLPPRSIFGLHLSDKDSPDNEGEAWWRRNVAEHRSAGFPLDHVVNDNRWRAGTGAWSGSWFEWDKARYPDPARYKRWADSMGLTITLDLNRNNGSLCAGWDSAYNIPNSPCVKENSSVPDYSVQPVRDWLWKLFWDKSLNPALKYPGDALWMDETDELICLPDSTRLQNGRRWAEEANLYQLRVAQAAIRDGWDNAEGGATPGLPGKRPFLWTRGSTAGAQRYATHWTGDIKSDYAWMRGTIRGMLASGLSGFPYFNHDAGGFRGPGPDDAMYIQWAMALGSFTPIWRPHGMAGSPRWPLRRSKACQEAMRKYGRLRYELMPYIYTMAIEASNTGMPMARAMQLAYPNHSEAWKHDLQYLWGPSMLVAPSTTGQDTTLAIWLPFEYGGWYSLWDDKKYKGGEIIQHKARVGELPVFVKAGAVIPKYKYATNTFLQKKDTLVVEVYVDENKIIKYPETIFNLQEDDGISEKYRQGERAVTRITYTARTKEVKIDPPKGTYAGLPQKRVFMVRFHGLENQKTIGIAENGNSSFTWENGVLVVRTEAVESATIKFM